MSGASIDDFDDAARALRSAMESSDPEMLDKAMTAFAAALETLRGVGAWRSDPALKERVRGIIARLDSDRRLSLLLGDLVRQRLAGIGSGGSGTLTYGRQG